MLLDTQENINSGYSYQTNHSHNKEAKKCRSDRSYKKKWYVCTS